MVLVAYEPSLYKLEFIVVSCTPFGKIYLFDCLLYLCNQSRPRWSLSSNKCIYDFAKLLSYFHVQLFHFHCARPVERAADETSTTWPSELRVKWWLALQWFANERYGYSRPVLCHHAPTNHVTYMCAIDWYAGIRRACLFQAHGDLALLNNLQIRSLFDKQLIRFWPNVGLVVQSWPIGISPLTA